MSKKIAMPQEERKRVWADWEVTRLRWEDSVKDGDKKHAIIHFKGLPEIVNLVESWGYGSDTAPDWTKGDCFWRYGEAESREKTREQIAKGELLPSLVAEIPKAEKRVQALLKKHQNLIKKHSVKVQRVYGEIGASVSFSRYLASDPDCLVRIKRGKPKKTVRIGLNCSMSCGNGQKEFTALAMSAYVVAKALETAGYATEIIGNNSAWAGNGDQEKMGSFVYPLKKASTRFDVQTIACASFPGILRDYMFVLSDIMQTGGNVGIGEYGYGMCLPLNTRQLKNMGINFQVSKAWASEGDGQSDFIGEIFDALENDDFSKLQKKWGDTF